MDQVISTPWFQYSALGLTLLVLYFFWRYIQLKEKQMAGQVERSEKRQDTMLEQMITMTTSSVAANVQAAETLKSIAEDIQRHDKRTEQSSDKVINNQAEIMTQIDTFRGRMPHE